MLTETVYKPTLVSLLCITIITKTSFVSTQTDDYSAPFPNGQASTTKFQTMKAQIKSNIYFDIGRCIIDMGPGKDDVINLGPLARKDGFPQFADNLSVPIPGFDVEAMYNFYFNPCIVYSLPQPNPHDCFGDGCHNAIICKSKHENDQCHYVTLGYHSEGTVKVNVGLKPNNDTTIALVYTGLGSQRYSKTVVRLVCDKERTKLTQALFRVVTDNGQGYVIMELHHDCCCVGGCWNAGLGLGASNVTDGNSSAKASSEKVLVLVGAFAGLGLIVLLIAVMCYVKKTHTEFYSKLPGVKANTSNSNSSAPVSVRKSSLVVSMKDTDFRDYEPVGPSAGEVKILPVLDICVIPFNSVEMRQRLGGNRFGDTHLGTWNKMTVTVKRLTLSIHNNQLTQETLALMKKEVSLISRQRHKNIVSILGICLDGRLPCLLTEYVVGECLKDYLRCSGHRLSWPQKIRMCGQIADGLTFLHSTKVPTIHRDLRCGNVFLCDNNLIKVADFSLMKLVQPLREQCDSDDCSCQRLQSACPATIRWTAPELLSNPRVKEGEDKVISPACDVYSFGLVMWEMLLFNDPFYKISSETEVIEIVKNGGRPDIPKGPDVMSQYRDLMKHCWDQQPCLRPTFKQVAHKLKDLIGAARSHQKQINSNAHRRPKIVSDSSPV